MHQYLSSLWLKSDPTKTVEEKLASRSYWRMLGTVNYTMYLELIRQEALTTTTYLFKVTY